MKYNGYFLVIAWALTAVLFILVSKTKTGYTILYFFVIASIIIVLAIGSPTIVSIFRSSAPTKQDLGIFTPTPGRST